MAALGLDATHWSLLAEQARDTDVLLSAGLARMDAGRTAAIGPLAPDLLDRRGADVPLSILELHGARQ